MFSSISSNSFNILEISNKSPHSLLFSFVLSPTLLKISHNALLYIHQLFSKLSFVSSRAIPSPYFVASLVAHDIYLSDLYNWTVTSFVLRTNESLIMLRNLFRLLKTFTHGHSELYFHLISHLLSLLSII